MFHSTRQNRTYEVLSEAGVDCLVCFDAVSSRWLTGFSGSTGVVVVNAQAGTTTLIVDPRYTVSVRAEVDSWGDPTVVVEADTSVDSYGVIKNSASGRVGVVASRVTLAQANALGKVGVEVNELDTDPLLRLRLVKDQDEIANMRTALAAAEQGFIAAEDMLNNPGATEINVRSALESAMLGAGATEVGFPTIVASGPNSLSPHATPTDRTIRDGEFVIIDFGGAINGYKSDSARTLWRGELSEQQIEVYETVRQALEVSTSVIAPGATYGQVKEAADKVLNEAGYGEYILHPFGHNIGLDTHERPYFSEHDPDASLEMQQGNIVALEPAVYVPDVGGVRVENLILVTADGCEVMNTLPVRSP